MPAHVKRQRTVENKLPSQMLALEPRYLFDAAVVTTVADVTSDPVAPPTPVTTAAAPVDLLVDGQQFAVSENTPAGTDLFEVTGMVLGDGYIDTQSGVGTLSWSITGGTGDTAFSITSDGKLQVLDPSQLDYETTTSFTLDVHAVDASGDYDDTTIDILVGNVVGEAPDINGTVPDQTVLGGNTLTVNIKALANPDDDDGDPINYALANAPAGASIDPDTGLFTWDTTFDQVGMTTITVLISNNFDVDQTNSLAFDVTVDPTLISISDAATVEEGNALMFTISLDDGATPTVATAGVASDSLYGVSLNGYSSGNPGSSSLYVIDETTGAGTFIGDIGYAVNSIAFDPTTGLMYGSTTSWSGAFNGLLQIDPATGAGTEIGTGFGSGFTSILGLSFNSAGDLFGWHDPGADDPVMIDKATGVATTIGNAGIGTGGQVLAFDNSDALILVQSSSQYDIDLGTGAAVFNKSLGFNPGYGGADIKNDATGNLWASAFNGRTQDSFIRVTDLVAKSFTDIDTDVEYLNALAFGGTGGFLPAFPTVTADLTMVTFSGSATPGTDYEPVFYSDAALTNPITSVMLGGSNPTTIDLYVKTFDNDPPFNEADETVMITLPSAAITNAIPGVASSPVTLISAIPDDTSAEGTITDSTLPTIDISDATPVEEGNALHYMVSLNGDTETLVTADLGFGAGTTATAGTDYEQVFYSDAALTNPITSVTLGNGTTSIDVYVKTFDNDPPYNEANENVEVELTAVTNATVTPAGTAADGTITDSTLPTINISDATPVEEGDALHYVVSLNGNTGTAVTANLGFGAGTTATGGATDDGTNDYQTTFYSDALLTTPITSVTLGGGNPTSINVYVQTFDNDPPYSETNENVVVALTSIANATGGDTAADGTITDSTPPPPTVNDATVILSEESSTEPGDESGGEGEEGSEGEEGEEGSEGEEGGEEGGPTDSGPAEGDEVTQEEAAEIEAEVEALVRETDITETAESPAAGKPESQPQTRAEEVAQIMSIMSKAATLVSCSRDLPNSPL